MSTTALNLSNVQTNYQLEKPTMPFRQPLADWEEVSRSVEDFISPSVCFSVTDDGMWKEERIGLFPTQPEPETGQLRKWELRVLDAIIDQINREPIPEPTQRSGPARDDFATSYLDLDNGATTYRLLETDRGGSLIRANDKLDRLEIAALDAFMDYLDNKYGSFSADTIIG
jgi:hypothetical protein